MSFITQNYEELHRAVAEAIEVLPAFRLHHDPIMGTFRHPSADAYAFAALLTVAAWADSHTTAVDAQEPMTINVTFQATDPEEAARKIVRIIADHRRRHGGTFPG
jgi:hypothetical protein